MEGWAGAQRAGGWLPREGNERQHFQSDGTTAKLLALFRTIYIKMKSNLHLQIKCGLSICAALPGRKEVDYRDEVANRQARQGGQGGGWLPAGWDRVKSNGYLSHVNCVLVIHCHPSRINIISSELFKL